MSRRVAAAWPVLTAAAFVLLAAVTGAMLALLVPLGQVVDEGSHLARAAALADGRLVGRRGPEVQPDGREALVSGIDVDAAIPDAVAWSSAAGPRPAERRAGPPPAWSGEQRFVTLYTIATYVPAFYAPSALGVGAARAFGIAPIEAATIGRIAGLSAFVLIGTAALLVAVHGQALLFAVLAVPMTLSLAASFNQDGLIVAVSVLAVACLTRVLAEREDGRPATGAFITACLSWAVLILVKPPYAPLAATLLLPLLARDGRPGWRRVLAGAGLLALVVLPALLWTWFVTGQVAAPVPRPPYEAGPLWAGTRPAPFTGTDPAAQLRVLLAHPLQILYLPWRFLTSVRRLAVLGEGTIGLLGWLELRLQLWLYLAWAGALLAAAWVHLRPRRPVAPPPTRYAPSRLRTPIVALAAIGTIWAVFLSQYVSWTDVGETSIIGPQGRYLLPVLPVLALLPARDGRLRDLSPGNLAWVPALVAAMGVLPLYRLVLATYGPG